MENLPIWQIVAWVVTALLSIVTFFSQIAIRSVTDKLKKHDDELAQGRVDLANAKMEIQELKALVMMNSEGDKHRMESLKLSFDSISDGIRDIKQSQSQQQSEIKSLDQRLTDYIIDTLKGKAAQK